MTKKLMKNIFKWPFSRSGFAVIELVVLVTLVLGTLAATKLVQQNQNPQKQAASCVKNACLKTGESCCSDNTEIPEWSCPTTHKACVSGLPDECITGESCTTDLNCPGFCEVFEGKNICVDVADDCPGDGGGYTGQACSTDSNPKCEGKNVGDTCSGGTSCTTDGASGPDGKLICKCKSGGGDGGGDGDGDGDDYGGYLPPATENRKSLCLSLTIDPTTVSAGESFTLTSQSKENANTFYYAFYNTDNLYGPGNAKPICVSSGGDVEWPTPMCPAGTSHLMYRDPDTTTPRTSGTRTVSFEEIFGISDANNNNQPVKNVSVNGYFLQADNPYNISLPEAACIKSVSEAGQEPTPVEETPTPTPTESPEEPTITPTPTIVINWYAPDGKICNKSNYNTYYRDRNCIEKAGYSTEIISGDDPANLCSADGTGFCFLAGGLPLVNQEMHSFDNLINDTCREIDTDDSLPTIYDFPYNCRLTEEPSGEISGEVTVDYVERSQFERLIVYLRDLSEDNYITFVAFPNEDIRRIPDDKPLKFAFPKLFKDKRYELYAKVFEKGGQNIETPGIIYESSCGNYACDAGPGTTDMWFKITLLDPAERIEADPSYANKLFEDAIEGWTKEEISAIEMSRIIEKLQRVPGLQKTSCDPKIPGGCTFW